MVKSSLLSSNSSNADSTETPSAAQQQQIDHENSYAYKNEISPSINDEPSSSASNMGSLPSPRSQIDTTTPTGQMKEIPLRPRSTSDEKMGNGNSVYEGNTIKAPRRFSWFGQNGHNNNNSINNNTNNLNDSTLGKKLANGKSSSPKKPLSEAVNLELVNMEKPANDKGNGVPVNNDTKVNIGDPHEGNVVPEDPHRNFMRCENWRQLLGWAVGLALPIFAIIFGFLAATYIILASEPTEIDSRQSNGGSKNNDNAIYPKTPEPPITTTDERIIYVNNTLEGQITLSNVEFLDEYNNHNSSVYQDLVRKLEKEIKQSLKPGEPNDNIFVKVMNLKSGSVVVDYRVSWPSGISEAPLKQETMKGQLSKYLTHNQGYLSVYLVPVNTIRVARLPDACAMNSIDLDCEHGCHYDEKLFDFTCKYSREPHDHHNEHEDNPSVLENDKSVQAVVHQPTAEPEPTTERESITESSSESKSRIEPELSGEPKPSAEPELSAEPEPSVEPESVGDSEHESHIHIIAPVQRNNSNTTEANHEPEITTNSYHVKYLGAVPNDQANQTKSNETLQHNNSTNEVFDTNRNTKDDSPITRIATNDLENSSKSRGRKLDNVTEVVHVIPVVAVHNSVEHEEIVPTTMVLENKTKIVVPVFNNDNVSESTTNIDKTENISPNINIVSVPVPVTEKIDDTPMPTESYFRPPVYNETQSGINIMDGHTIDSSKNNDSTLYSTSPPIVSHKWNETSVGGSFVDESVAMSPFLPNIESTSSTENLTKGDTIFPMLEEQSPFLPQYENNATLIDILRRSYEIELATKNGTINQPETSQKPVIYNQMSIENRIEPVDVLHLGVIPLNTHDDEITTISVTENDIKEEITIGTTETIEDATIFIRKSSTDKERIEGNEKEITTFVTQNGARHVT